MARRIDNGAIAESLLVIALVAFVVSLAKRLPQS
jgi:hypothetical protein